MTVAWPVAGLPLRGSAAPRDTPLPKPL